MFACARKYKADDNNAGIFVAPNIKKPSQKKGKQKQDVKKNQEINGHERQYTVIQNPEIKPHIHDIRKAKQHYP